MKISREEQNKLINGLMPMLKPVSKKIGEKEEMWSGSKCIEAGIIKTATGQFITRKNIYPVKVPIMAELNHEKAIKKVISDAKTESQMMNDLSLYLSKNALSLEAIKS